MKSSARENIDVEVVAQVNGFSIVTAVKHYLIGIDPESEEEQ